MKLLIILSIMMLVFGNCFSQNKEEKKLTDVTKLTFFNPGISYEKPIGKFQSLYAQAFLSTSFFFSYSDALGTASGIHFDPAFALQFRYYYNFINREAKGKRTDRNSLNYISLGVRTAFSKEIIESSYYPEKHNRAISTIGLVWGLQRNYPKRFSLDLNIGPGLLYTGVTEKNASGEYVSRNIFRYTTLVDINLGFWINRRK